MNTRLQNSQNCQLAYETGEPDVDTLIRLRDTLRRQLLSLSDGKHADAVTAQINRLNKLIDMLDKQS